MSRPRAWHLPASEQEVVRLVAGAAADRRRLRVVGAGHSFSRIAAPDDDAVSLDALAGPVDVHDDRTRVTVPAGMRLRDLSAVLAGRGLALPIVGSIQSQSVAGAIATGTHGSSLRHPNLAGLVTAVRLVDGTGRVVALDEADPRVAGARVHLGALGIVTQLTLRVQAARTLCQVVEDVPVAAVPEILVDVAHSAEYVKVWWLPHARTAQVIRYDATERPVTRWPSVAMRRRLDDRVMHAAVFPALIGLQRRRPQVTAAVNRFLSSRYLGPRVQAGRDTLMLTTPMPFRHRETEAALPLGRAPEAVAQVLGLFADGRPAVNFPLEIRFVAGDDTWLSPAFGADACQIGAYCTDIGDCETYFAAFWTVMRSQGARPHWGKELDHDAAELRALYPEYDRFTALRDDLDPHRVFGGTLHEQLLGP